MVKLFNESSNAQGMTKLQTLESLLLQFQRLSNEIEKDAALPIIGIQLNAMKTKHVKPMQNTIREIERYIVEQIKIDDEL